MPDTVSKHDVVNFLFVCGNLNVRVFFCVENIFLIVSYRLKRELERRGGGGKKVKRRRQRENGEN